MVIHNFFIVEEIERQWLFLKDMFSRENRRQMLPPSGSGYERGRKGSYIEIYCF